MPYIKQKDRTPVNGLIDALAKIIGELPEDQQDGTMNYTITKLMRGVYPLRYRHQNRAMGVLECVKQEHYRRVIGPYEDLKIKENGDVE